VTTKITSLIISYFISLFNSLVNVFLMIMMRKMSMVRQAVPVQQKKMAVEVLYSIGMLVFTRSLIKIVQKVATAIRVMATRTTLPTIIYI